VTQIGEEQTSLPVYHEKLTFADKQKHRQVSRHKLISGRDISQTAKEKTISACTERERAHTV
jgi:hypothetical protein